MEKVYIVNQIQMAKYLKHGLKPIDMFYDMNTNKVVYIYNKEESKPLFEKWIKYELD